MGSDTSYINIRTSSPYKFYNIEILIQWLYYNSLTQITTDRNNNNNDNNNSNKNNNNNDTIGGSIVASVPQSFVRRRTSNSLRPYVVLIKSAGVLDVI